MSGEVVLEQTIQVTSGQDTYQVDANTFPPGMYMIEVRDEMGKVYQTKYVME